MLKYSHCPSHNPMQFSIPRALYTEPRALLLLLALHCRCSLGDNDI
jgi:hypothetical protein